ncbi:MAG: leucine-rich repeat domain-containing protein [Crocinitomicaceae bacterium]|nr:leucine-rich repeat domain-containing protein [Crocinitomicaceae bacterium]
MKTLLLLGALALTINSFAQNVNIPDANFKAYLVGNSLINTNLDTEIQVSEANAFGGDIFCNGLNVSDLTGIEAFTALTYLRCFDNQLTSLDVTQNTALTYLDCYNNQLTSLDLTQNTALNYLYCHLNQLTSLDVSQNTDLTELFCSQNQLTSLDVTQNTALTGLFCDNNQLTSLDVSQNTALTYLRCNGNQLTSLDVTQNTALTNLLCDNNQLICLNVKNGNNANFTIFSATVNPNLTCIEVDDVAYSTTNWTNIDPQTSFSTACANPCALGLNELSNTPKQLVKIVDLMGRETPYKPNTVFIYVFDDGSTEKVFKMDE